MNSSPAFADLSKTFAPLLIQLRSGIGNGGDFDRDTREGRQTHNDDDFFRSAQLDYERHVGLWLCVMETLLFCSDEAEDYMSRHPVIVKAIRDHQRLMKDPEFLESHVHNDVVVRLAGLVRSVAGKRSPRKSASKPVPVD